MGQPGAKAVHVFIQLLYSHQSFSELLHSKIKKKNNVVETMNYFASNSKGRNQPKTVVSPCSNEIQEVLPSVSNFVEFLFNL